MKMVPGNHFELLAPKISRQIISRQIISRQNFSRQNFPAKFFRAKNLPPKF
jgi:hypothetical protein